MSMMAVFTCSQCGHEAIHGYYRAQVAPAPPPEFACLKCKAKTVHIFRTYTSIDERSDAQRMRERLQQQ